MKWFLALAIAGGLLFVGLFVDFSTRSVSVSTALAQAASVANEGGSVLDATGYVVARRQTTVSAKTTGKVVRVLIEEGDRVQRDQLLAVLDDTIPRAQFELTQSQLDASRAGLEELRVQLKQAQLDLDRTRELADRKLASQADLDRDGLDVEALNARLDRAEAEVVVAQRSLAVQKQLLDDMEIRAPFDGIVVAKAAQPGEMISPVSAGGGFTRTGICTIVDMDSLEVEVDVNESYINRVYPGQPVQVTLNAYPEDQISRPGHCHHPDRGSQQGDGAGAGGAARSRRSGAAGYGCAGGFSGRGRQCALAEQSDAVLIPASAVASDAAGDYVFVVRGDRAERRTVTTGATVGTKVKVSSGIVTGERVVLGLSDDLLASLQAGEPLTFLN